MKRFFAVAPQRDRHRLLIDSLYYGSSCPCCSASRPVGRRIATANHPVNALSEGSASASISIDADVLASFLRKIYDGFDTSHEIEPSIWREVLRVINSATVEGLSQSSNRSLSDDFLAALRHSNEVFAAFKVHQMGSDMAAKLLDANGNLKPFRQWLNDVSSISTHHCGAWLRTEYDTAVVRTHTAADWQSFLRNKDVMPNLRWMPTTSPNPESSIGSFGKRSSRSPSTIPSGPNTTQATDGTANAHSNRPTIPSTVPMTSMALTLHSAVSKTIRERTVTHSRITTRTIRTSVATAIFTRALL